MMARVTVLLLFFPAGSNTGPREEEVLDQDREQKNKDVFLTRSVGRLCIESS
jgi:hypothetical protein